MVVWDGVCISFWVNGWQAGRCLSFVSAVQGCALSYSVDVFDNIKVFSRGGNELVSVGRASCMMLT